MSLQHKIDFAVIFTVKNANPNGDPLNGNRPRTTLDGNGERRFSRDSRPRHRSGSFQRGTCGNHQHPNHEKCKRGGGWKQKSI